MFDKIIIAIITSIIILFSSVSVYAKERLQIDAYVEDDYMRLMFYLDPTTYFDPILNGNRVEIVFNKEFKPNFAKLLAEEDSVVEKAQSQDDGKKIILDLSDKKTVSTVRQFVGDGIIGIDLVFASKDNQGKKKTVAILPKFKPEVNNVPNYLPVLRKKPQKSDIKVQVEANKTQNEHVVEKKTEEKVQRNIEKPIEKLQTVEAAQPAITNSTEDKKKEQISKQIKPDVQIKDNIIKFTFPMGNDTGAAVFHRGDITWVVFDQYTKIDISHMTEFFEDDTTVIKQLDNTDNTIIQIRNEAIAYHVVHKIDNAWSISVSDEPILKRRYETTFKLARHPFSPELLIMNQEPSKILKITDDIVGDELIIATFIPNGFLFKDTIRYIDFDLLSTAQGAAIVLYADGIKHAKIDNGFSVYMPSKIIEHNDRDEKMMENMLFVPATDSFFNFDVLNDLTEDISFQELLHQYYRGIIFSPPAQKNLKRMELADFFFAYGFLHEARGLLNYIEQSDTLYDKNKLAMMQGAIAWRHNDYEKANKLIKSVEVEEDNPKKQVEHRFWYNLVQTSRNPEEISRIEYKDHVDNLLLHYPKSLRHLFAIKDIESALNRDDGLGYAETLLDMIEKEGLNPQDRGYVLYLEGILAQKSGEFKKAAKIWTALSDDVLDRKNRVIASLALVRQQYNLKHMSLKDAISKLEHLSFTWRNDPLEIELLEYLGELLVEDNRLVDALNTWKAATKSNTYSSKQFKLTAAMSKLFTDIFLNEDREFISDLKAIGLYYDYRELTPVGKKGDEVIDMLIKRLINIDLLDRAAELMEYQVNNRKKGIERENMITSLAEIYLIDKRPEDAVRVLSSKRYIEIPDKEVKKRYYMHVISLLEMDRINQALALMNNDTSDDAQDLKMHIYWKYHLWQELANLLEPKVNILKEAVDSNYKLTDQEEDILLRLAIAYHMSSNKDGLNVLASHKFLEHVSDNSNITKTLEFLFNNNGDINPMMLDTTSGLKNLESYVDYYKNVIQPSVK